MYSAIVFFSNLRNKYRHIPIMMIQLFSKRRKKMSAKIANETGKTIISSSDNYDVMAGQGTIALELLEEVVICFISLVVLS